MTTGCLTCLVGRVRIAVFAADALDESCWVEAVEKVGAMAGWLLCGHKLFNKLQPISVGVGRRELLMAAGDSGYRNAH